MKKSVELHRWCAGRWDEVHMSWAEVASFVDPSLPLRDRLIYWLLRVWQTYNAGSEEISAIYE